MLLARKLDIQLTSGVTFASPKHWCQWPNKKLQGLSGFLDRPFTVINGGKFTIHRVANISNSQVSTYPFDSYPYGINNQLVRSISKKQYHPNYFKNKIIRTINAKKNEHIQTIRSKAHIHNNIHLYMIKNQLK